MRGLSSGLALALLAACGPAATATLRPNQAQPTSIPATVAPTPSPTRPAPTIAPPPKETSRPPTTTATPAPAVTLVPPDSFEIGLEPIASGFDEPVFVTHAGDDRLFVVEQDGRIRVVEDGVVLRSPFLDIDSIVDSDGYEQGLLGLAFHPAYSTNGEFFVNYTREPDGATVIARYRVSGDPNVADPNSEQIVLTIAQPQANHNGGMLAFGPDGDLYIGMGDGGGAGDQHGLVGNAQDPDAQLGKMLRMNVDTGAVSIWASGLRNPWRFSFDRATGDLYIGDVGQGEWEEIDFQLASSAGGENYGWRIMEGAHCYNPSTGCDRSGLTLPVAEYSHDGHCSVTGGYVYRGSTYPWLNGVYFFADFCSGVVWSLARGADGEWAMAEMLDTGLMVSSFGEDAAGEMYLVDHDDGVMYRLTSSSR